MKALEETSGDLDKAKDILRKKGLVDAEKRLDRVTSEGLVGIKIDTQNQKVTMLEMHCETDFVAKTDSFKHGVEVVLNTFHNTDSLKKVTQQESKDQEFIKSIIKQVKLSHPLDTDASSQTIEEGLKYIISKT